MKTGTIVKYILVAVLIILILMPFILAVFASFKPYKEIMSSKVTLLPTNWTLNNYEPVTLIKGEYEDFPTFVQYLGRKFAIAAHLQPGRAAKGVRDFPQYVINSFVTSLGAALLAVVVATLAGYGLARYRFPARNILGRSMLFIYVFPTILLVVPVYKLFAELTIGEASLLDSHYGLMLIYATIAAPFLTWLLRSFFESIPREIEESAEVDGAGGIARFLRITLPLAAPGIITAAIYGFVTSWGEYLFAAILITSGDNKTGPIGLSAMTTEQYIEWGPLLAGATLIVFPILIFFFPIAKYFVQGFMAGAVKE
jgi:ABC-type glycerol-3-phosphate transport system permease component